MSGGLLAGEVGGKIATRPPGSARGRNSRVKATTPPRDCAGGGILGAFTHWDGEDSAAEVLEGTGVEG